MSGSLTITSNTVWSSGSVRDLTGVMVQVAAGVTLTIERGAALKGCSTPPVAFRKLGMSCALKPHILVESPLR